MLEFGRDEKSGAYVYRSSNQAQSNNMAGAEQQVLEQQGGEAQASEPEVVQAEVQEPRARQQQLPRSDSRRRGGRGYRSEAVVNDQAPVAQEAEAIDPIELQPPMPKPQAKGDARRGAGRNGRNGRKKADVYEPVPNQAELERQMHLAQGDDEDEHEPVVEVMPVRVQAEPEPEPEPAIDAAPVVEKRRTPRKPAARKTAAPVEVGPEPVVETVETVEAMETVEPAAPAKPARKSPARPRRPAKAEEA
jgi:hypothetical protein